MKTTLRSVLRVLGLALTVVASSGLVAQAAQFYLGGGVARHAVDGGFDGKTAYVTQYAGPEASVLAGKIQPGNGPLLELGVLGENHVFLDFQGSRTSHRATHYLSNNDVGAEVTEAALTIGYALPVTPALNLYAGLGLASYNITLNGYYTSTEGKHYQVTFKGDDPNTLSTLRFTAGVWYRFEDSVSIRAGVAHGSPTFTSVTSHGSKFTIDPALNPDIYTADVSFLYLFSGGK